MNYLSGIVTDETGVIVAGALVYIYDNDGVLAELKTALGAALSNPVTSDATGFWEARTDDSGYFTIKYNYGGRLRRIEANVVVGRTPLEEVTQNLHFILPIDLSDEEGISAGTYDLLYNAVQNLTIFQVTAETEGGGTCDIAIKDQGDTLAGEYEASSTPLDETVDVDADEGVRLTYEVSSISGVVTRLVGQVVAKPR
jgi:hypothetical protein